MPILLYCWTLVIECTVYGSVYPCQADSDWVIDFPMKNFHWFLQWIFWCSTDFGVFFCCWASHNWFDQILRKYWPICRPGWDSLKHFIQPWCILRLFRDVFSVQPQLHICILLIFPVSKLPFSRSRVVP